MAQGATPDGGDAGRWNDPKLKNCNIKIPNRNAGIP
jgi:hypothetical protein